MTQGRDNRCIKLPEKLTLGKFKIIRRTNGWKYRVGNFSPSARGIVLIGRHIKNGGYLLRLCFLSLKIFKNILFLERGGGRKRRETPMCGCLSHTLPTGDLAYNTGMRPDWDSNR